MHLITAIPEMHAWVAGDTQISGLTSWLIGRVSFLPRCGHADISPHRNIQSAKRCWNSKFPRWWTNRYTGHKDWCKSYEINTSWWLNHPFEYVRQNGNHFPNFWGENKTKNIWVATTQNMTALSNIHSKWCWLIVDGIIAYRDVFPVWEAMILETIRNHFSKRLGHSFSTHKKILFT